MSNKKYEAHNTELTDIAQMRHIGIDVSLPGKSLKGRPHGHIQVKAEMLADSSLMVVTRVFDERAVLLEQNEMLVTADKLLEGRDSHG